MRGRLGKVHDRLRAMQFGLLRSPRSGADDQHIDLHRVTVVDRWIPLETAAYGTRVARPARMTMPASGSDGSQLDQRVRSVLGGHRLWPRTRRAHGSVSGETRTPLRLSPPPQVRGL
jgi:hypothetical protein